MFVPDKKIQLLGILILAACFRFTFLADNPPGLFRDEADKGYSTYSLIETGQDLGGRKWPLQIQSFNAFTSPFYHWLSIPSIGFLGLNVWSTRLVAALAGTLACAAIYLLGRAWASEKLGLLAALLLAISPWHLLFSRWANQGILMTLFIPLALWATWRAIEEDEDRRWRVLGYIFLGGVCWGISWNTYAPARLFIPLLMTAIFLIHLCFSEKRGPDCGKLFFIGIISVGIALPFAFDILLKWEETQTRLAFLRSGEPLTVGGFFLNYVKHWNPGYLFLFGDENPRHHILGQGQLSVMESLLFLVGIFGLFKTTGLWRGWLLSWLLLAPIPAALTNEGLPHALRTLMGAPGFAVLAAVGLAWVFHLLSTQSARLAAGILSLAVLLQTGATGYLFFQKYPNDEKVALAWETGLVEAIAWTESVRVPGEVCIVTGILEFPEAYLQFVLQPDPERVQRSEEFDGYRLLPLGLPTDPHRHRVDGLFLERAQLAGKPPYWKKVPPTEEYSKMDYYWRLYRVRVPKD